MPQCAVATCRNSHRRTRAEAVRYHRFPRAEGTRELWVSACGRSSNERGDPSFNIATARICSIHFVDDFYEKDGPSGTKRSRLKPGAVPTLHVPVAVEPLVDMMNVCEKKRLNQTSKAGQGPKVAMQVRRRTNQNQIECSQQQNNVQAEPSKRRGNNKMDANRGINGAHNGGPEPSCGTNAQRGTDDNFANGNTSNTGRNRSGCLSNRDNVSFGEPSTSKQADRWEYMQDLQKIDVSSRENITKEQYLLILGLVDNEVCKSWKQR